MSNRSRFLAGLILLVLLVTFLPGQSTTARITGNVKDEDGKYLSGVTATATLIESNAVVTTVTGKKGKFRFLALYPGTYQVSFDLEGYQSYVVSGIHLSAEQSNNLRIKLKKNE